MSGELDLSGTEVGVLADATLPRSAAEDWRYGPIDTLDFEALSRVNPTPAVDQADGGEPWVELLGGGFDAVLRIANGRIVGFETGESGTVRRVDIAHPSSLDEGEPFAYLAAALSPERITVELGDRDSPSRLLCIRQVSAGSDLHASEVTFQVPAGMEASVVEVRTGGSLGAFSAIRTNVRVADDAHLSYVSVQDLARDTWELAHLDGAVARSGRLRALHLALGGDYARLRTECRLNGAGAEAEILAGYLGTGNQTHEFRTFQIHEAAKTQSNLLYKGALGGSSHSIYSGLIKVEKGATGSNAFQTNRNIVLGDHAHADSVPNLDIQENEVKCSHASAVGPVDAEQTYYLESKGIPTQAAQQMIVRGFFRELLDNLPLGSLDSLVDRSLDGLWDEESR
ncbi:MAG: SufB/SufD family protein [Acidimicrobiales bacterium]